MPAVADDLREADFPLLKELSAREMHHTYDSHDHWEDAITKEAQKSASAIEALPSP